MYNDTHTHIRAVLIVDCSPNIGNTLQPVLTVFTRLRITPPKVNRFGWNLDHSEHIVWGWPWQILGVIRTLQERKSQAKKFCHVNNARLYRFLVSQISQNLNTTSIGETVNHFGTEFRKFPREGSFIQKTQNFRKNFKPLATSCRHNSAMITDRQKFVTKWSLYGMSTYIRVSRRPREMYCGHARLCVCVCVCPRPHAHTIARTRM